ncbi:hypothetical protein NIES2107_74790 (plasmid) [Nostoc carneum NIES-2107]|nr:hypothetical protein NIES2107_74790 [Nostoc carneum NIES-2107]
MKKFQTIIGTGIGLVFMVVGGGLIPMGYQELKNAQESLKWLTTDGVIVLSEIKEIKDEDSTIYHANVRYQYSVGEKSYLSEQVSFGQYDSSDPEHAQSIVQRYEQGQKVSVHFNSVYPNESVLEPGVSWGSYMPLGISTIFFITGTIFAALCGIVVPQQRQRRTEALRQVASTLALDFLESDKMLEHEDFFKFPLFHRGSSLEIRNILRKRSAAGEAILFDHEFQQGSGENSSQYSQTVAAFHISHQNLPEFSLRPENVFDKIGEFFGHQDIDFESYQEFSKSYRLQGQLEPAIRETFNFHVLQFFSHNSGWWLEGKGEWLVIYQMNRQVKPKELSNFLMQTSEISQLFT